MKEEISLHLIDLLEKRKSVAEFRDIFFEKYNTFETVFINTTEDSINHDIFYKLIEIDYNTQANEVLHLVKKYLNHNKIEIALTDEKIALVDEKLGFILPKSYTDFMKNFNEEFFEDPYVIPIKETVPANLKYYLGEGFWEINDFYKILIDENDTKGILHGKSIAKEWGLLNKIIPLEGDGHTWIAFDYRNTTNEPEIVFIESEKHLSLKLANNFTELLDMLPQYNSVYDEDGNIIYKSTS